MSTPTSFLACVSALAVVTSLVGCGASLTPSEATADASVSDPTDAPPVDAPPIVDAPPAVDAPAVVRPDVFVPLSPPRPLAPLSTATVTTRRPTLRWAPGPGSDATRVEVCRDRACAVVVHSMDVTTDRNHPAFDLPPGAYFWRLFALAGGRTHPTPGPTWEFFVGPRSAPIDASWGTALDLNGDGFADLVASTSGPTRHIVIHHGGPSGVGSEPAAVLSETNDGFGAAIAGAGDVDGDGYGDLLVQSSYAFGDGDASFRVHVLSGGATGVTRTPATTLTVPAPGCVGELMVSMASAGDVNGDGYADVVIGAPCAESVGRAYIFLGGEHGLGATPAATVPGRDWASRFGWSVAAADFNADGLSDVAVSAWGRSSGWSGEVTVFNGSRSGVADGVRMVWEPGVAGFATTLACGDVDGDGYADLAVASRGGGGSSSPTGVVHVFAGSYRSLLTAVPLASLTDPMPPSRGSYFAGDVGVRDLDGDGYADVVATAYSASEGRHWLRLFDGGPTGPARSPTDSVELTSVSAAHYASGQVAVGDHDGDGHADLSVIGSTLSVFPRGPTRGGAPGASIAAPEGEQFAAVIGSR